MQSNAKRIGVFGGTFDPVHLGHLILAETARDLCGLDEIWMMPVAMNPHKPGYQATSGKLRLQLLEFAIAGHAQFRVCDHELKRTGPSFTVDTLRELSRDHPQVEWSLLMGADSLDDFPNWREPLEILRLARIIAVNRGRDVGDLAAVIHNIGPLAEQRIQLIDMPPIGISATDIRERVRNARSIRFLTPRPVELAIAHHGLYRN